MKPHEIELRKDRFFFRKSCAYCGSCDKLELDRVQPYTWVSEEVWKLSDYELNRLFVSEIQILCNTCLLRKKRIWKQYRKEGGNWLKPYLEEAWDTKNPYSK